MLDIFDEFEAEWVDVIRTWQSKKSFMWFKFNMELLYEIQTS